LSVKRENRNTTLKYQIENKDRAGTLILGLPGKEFLGMIYFSFFSCFVDKENIPDMQTKQRILSMRKMLSLQINNKVSNDKICVYFQVRSSIRCTLIFNFAILLYGKKIFNEHDIL